MNANHCCAKQNMNNSGFQLKQTQLGSSASFTFYAKTPTLSHTHASRVAFMAYYWRTQSIVARREAWTFKLKEMVAKKEGKSFKVNFFSALHYANQYDRFD